MSTPQALLDVVETLGAPAGGRLTGVRGIVAEAHGLELPIGGLAEIETPLGLTAAEVVGFREESVQLMPLGSMRGAAVGSRVWPHSRQAGVPVTRRMLGRVIDAVGEPIDQGPPLVPEAHAPLYREQISPLDRPVIDTPLDVGVRAVNCTATLGRGQRVGLFAGSGVGKSTLLGMIVRGTNADVRVVGLIGERGREVREFIERELGAARATTIVVAVPSDSSPLLRTRGAYVATAIAEWFRDQSADVLLLMDSITRFATAAREIGLARGEPATTKGYTPSVFAELPKLLERAGRTRTGSITGIYSVLVEGGDMEDPIADSLRALLDGHIVLSRDFADRGQFPAIDVLASVSRAMPLVTDGRAPRSRRSPATAARRLPRCRRSDSGRSLRTGQRSQRRRGHSAPTAHPAAAAAGARGVRVAGRLPERSATSTGGGGPVRRSKLGVIRRLAKLEADRALRGLGEAQSSVRRLQSSLDLVRASSEASQRARALHPGEQIDAAMLSAAHKRELWLTTRDESLADELGETRLAAEMAREGVAKAKLRVRAIENAIARRQQRARREARRAESRQLDEITRGRMGEAP